MGTFVPTKLVMDKDDGYIIEPPVHDMEIIGIRLNGSNQCCLDLVADDERNFRLTLDGLWRLQINGFRTQNVIFGIWVVTGSEVAPDTVRDAYEPEEFDHAQRSGELQKTLDHIKNGSLTYVVSSTSVGAWFAAMCNSIRFEVEIES